MPPRRISPNSTENAQRLRSLSGVLPLFRTRSAAVYGIDAHLIDVEVDLWASGSARDFIMVGMPDTAVRESRERIKSALLNSGFGYPSRPVTINLAPANVRKEGAGFDLPMAIGILGAMGTAPPTERHLFAGELSLDGTIRPVRGALPIAACARKQGIENLVVPAENAAEARRRSASHATACSESREKKLGCGTTPMSVRPRFSAVGRKTFALAIW